MARVLLVDDEPDFRKAAAEMLEAFSHEISAVESLAQARKHLDEERPDVVLLDLMLPDGNGLELLDDLSTVREAGRPPQKVVLMTGHPGIKSQIKDLKGPAVTFLTKPFQSGELLRAVDGFSSPTHTGHPSSVDAHLHFGVLVGDHERMQRMYRQIEKVAKTDTPVLIVGETGTGKELVAEAIHHGSGRKGAFVVVNCGSLPSELAGSELFGHEKGSFTGAVRGHTGHFKRADDGTLFLDELAEMPIELQPHFLRVLETNKVTPVGGEKEWSVNCRVVAATNREPEVAISSNLLRPDLYFRLSAFPITVPPLRDRPSDIPTLATYFLDEFQQHPGERYFSQDSLRRLQAYHWPGNVRELRHVVQRAFILAEGDGLEIPLPDRFDSPFTSPVKRGGVEPGRSIRDVERELIERTLAHFDGDKKNAASVLGISLNTLYNRLNSYQRPKSA
jgi:DNA-binding NtrC family response regulator